MSAADDLDQKLAPPESSPGTKARATLAQLKGRRGLLIRPELGGYVAEVESMGEWEKWVCISGNPTTLHSVWERES